jgi:hypothetical protein
MRAHPVTLTARRTRRQCNSASGGDYSGKTTGAITFAAGSVAKTISVAIWADSNFDVDETLTITPSGLSGAGVTDVRATGTGTILAS